MLFVSPAGLQTACDSCAGLYVPSFHIVAIFYPFSQFCEINISLLSLQKEPNTAPNVFQRRVEYGKYVSATYVSEISYKSMIVRFPFQVMFFVSTECLKCRTAHDPGGSRQEIMYVYVCICI